MEPTTMTEVMQNTINEAAEESEKNTLWGKPANDILNGRDSSASAKPIRAIWEMVQNARDVSSNNEAQIVFTRKKGVLEFKHDGIPFTHDTLNALILQTSAKSRDDGDQVGQYGTGFLTTHKFGRKFHLRGSLQLVNNENVYYNFPELIVDRTPNSRPEMMTNLIRQIEQKNGWLKDPTYRRDTPEQWTIFTYFQPNEIESKNVEEAFTQAPEVIPYVLCLNEGIRSIVLRDEINDRTISFTRGEKEQKEETCLAKLFSTSIDILNSKEGRTETVEILTLESKKTVTTKQRVIKAMTTVILPICNRTVYQPSSNIARLFIYLPLVGSECWGTNFMLQAPMFTCLTDDRSSLRLIRDGQTENDPASENQQYIQEATDIIFEYLRLHVSEWIDVHYLAPIEFDITNANPGLSDYYKSLKKSWLQNMQELEIVEVQTPEEIVRKKPSDIHVPDETLAKAIAEKEELLLPIHRILSQMYKNAIPVSDQLVYWSDILAHWYVDENCEQAVDISEIVEYIANHGMTVISEADLFIICQYLSDSEQLVFFDQNILLTEDGTTLTNKTEGYRNTLSCGRLKSCLKILLPEHTGLFVKDEFASLIQLTPFDNTKVKEALSACTEKLQNEIKSVSDAAKTAWEKTTTVPATREGLLTDEQRKALMDYCRMVIPKSSTSFQAKVLELTREYYAYDVDFEDTIDGNFFGWKGAIHTLLGHLLTEFTILADEEKAGKTDWIRRLITCLYESSDFKRMLGNYRIYLSQSEEFCYSEALKKDSGIPEKMKDIYDVIVSAGEETPPIRKTLFAPDFGQIAPVSEEWAVIIVGQKIMEKIKESDKYLHEIDSYEHKDFIMDIMNHFDDETEGKAWQTAFETIHKDTPSLLAKLVLNKENREPMIKIMKIKDRARLNKVAEIMEDENLNHIWEMGKSAWIEKQNRQLDFDKKKELGQYVEEYLRQELKTILNNHTIEVKVDDVQGGQDIIISVNGEPIHYIEVKSRWVPADSVTMSAMQLERSVEKKDCYSLFAVDMVGFNGEHVKEHIYPESMDEFVSRIRIVNEIGYLNAEIMPTERDPTEQVHIGGDYKAVVPQNLIRRNHVNYKTFIEKLKEKVEEFIQRVPSGI